jgi:tRNA-Thr(GGU) m(6)t(6)A37 methyltransferase TsaA
LNNTDELNSTENNMSRVVKIEGIEMYPIGIIHSPYKRPEDVPIQGKFKEDILGKIELYEKYKDGLLDLNEFSHAFIIFHLHKSNREKILAKPYLENIIHGVFSIRTPHRPNHIGLSIIKILNIENNFINFKWVDMIDKTPVLDIKPYISYFDCIENTKNGWLEKHFKNGVLLNKKIKN